MTAVDYLVNEIKESLKDGDIDFLFYRLKKELIEQAKEMEKQQQGYSEEDLREAFIEGHNICRCVTDNTDEVIECFEQFKKK